MSSQRTFTLLSTSDTDLLAAGGRYTELYRTQFDQPGEPVGAAR